MTSPCTLPLSAWVGKRSTRDRGWSRCAARDDSPLTDLHLLTYYTYLLMYLLTYLRARRPRGYQEVPARTRALPRADVSREQSVVSTNLLTCLLLTNTCLLLTCLLKRFDRECGERRYTPETYARVRDSYGSANPRAKSVTDFVKACASDTRATNQEWS